MLKAVLKYKFPIILIGLLYVFHLCVKDFSSPYEKSIVGDAKAYYAYLPAIFIHQDSQYSFIDDYEEKYYAENQKKDFLNETVNGKKVNKTFPGAAILYFPTFIVAHGLALISGQEADGYSIIYQYAFDFGYWLFLLLGAIFYLKIFRLLKFKENHIQFSLAILIVGTNIFFYSVVDQSVTHIFNFCLVNAFIYHALMYKEFSKMKHIYFGLALLLLIGITRPTNVLVLLLLVIFIPKLQFYKTLLLDFIKPKTIAIVLGTIALIGSIPFLLWQWQTGNWVVYSYGDEGFDFSNPEIFNFLWSYTKGWFVYTPVALIILTVGLYYKFKDNVFQTSLMVVFYAISIFVFSSWWCWYYGAGMGQRVMIDYYVLLGLLLLFTLQKAGTILKRILATTLVLLMCFNIVQAFQIKNGIYPMGSPDKTVYWDNFLSLTKKAKVYDKLNWKLKESKLISFSQKDGFITKGAPKENGDKYFIQTNELETYSPSFTVSLKNPTTKIVISWIALAQTEIAESRLVITSTDESKQNKVIYIKAFTQLNESTQMEFLVEFSQPINEFEAYFWNGNTSEIVDYYDFKIESYK